MLLPGKARMFRTCRPMLDYGDMRQEKYGSLAMDDTKRNSLSLHTFDFPSTGYSKKSLFNAAVPEPPNMAVFAHTSQAHSLSRRLSFPSNAHTL